MLYLYTLDLSFARLLYTRPRPSMLAGVLVSCRAAAARSGRPRPGGDPAGGPDPAALELAQIPARIRAAPILF